ncbi:EpsG family protein [Fictibacillus halophilus]|uniref:EpsG family protein n=1 Tax=Fictibacillus halophilus TaxID=1610490 RepID=UPI003632607E
MTILWINLAFVYVFSLFARYFSSESSSLNNVKPNQVLVLLCGFTLVLVSGLRNNIGDTYYYKHSYEMNTLSWGNVDFSGDFGFNIFQMILQKISDNSQILIFTTALITNSLIVFILYKYSRLFELSLYIYITSGLFLVSMNGIRQFMAASIIFAATKYIFNGNWKTYFFIIILASTIHQSALILLPIYFIVRNKAWSKFTYLLIFLSLFIVAGYNQFSQILFASLEDTQYGHYQSFSEGGANILRVLVSAVPIVLAYMGREKLREIFPKSDYIVNLSIVGLLFLIVSTQNWIFARFTIYFGLYQLILISWVVKIFRKQDEKFIYYLIVLFYFLFYFYECVIIFGTEYQSNYLG